MTEEPSFDDISPDSDPEGDMETRTVQTPGRVDIPDEYLEHIGAEEGEKVIVLCGEDEVTITKATKEKLFNNARE